MHEHVDLPDEGAQRLVHPLDQPEARRRFHTALKVLAGSAAVFAAAAGRLFRWR